VLSVSIESFGKIALLIYDALVYYMRETKDLPGADGMATLAPPREGFGGAMVLVA